MQNLYDLNETCSGDTKNFIGPNSTSVGIPVQIGLSLVLGASAFIGFCVS